MKVNCCGVMDQKGRVEVKNQVGVEDGASVVNAERDVGCGVENGVVEGDGKGGKNCGGVAAGGNCDVFDCVENETYDKKALADLQLRPVEMVEDEAMDNSYLIPGCDELEACPYEEVDVDDGDANYLLVLETLLLRFREAVGGAV